MRRAGRIRFSNYLHTSCITVIWRGVGADAWQQQRNFELHSPTTNNRKVCCPMARIPKALQPHINTAFPNDVCLIATVLPSGYAQVTPRGSTLVFDDGHFSLWERGKGSTTENLIDGKKVTIYFRKPQLRADGILPKGGIARFYGAARLHKSGPVYEEVWNRLIQPEKDRSRQERLRGADRGRTSRRTRRDPAFFGLRLRKLHQTPGWNR